LDRKVSEYDMKIAKHVRAKPASSDFPTNAELAEWDREYEQLVSARQEAVNRRCDVVAIREPRRLKAMKAARQVESLAWSVRGLENRIAGLGIEGGVKFV
jgi:hypothetical protein